MRTLKWREKRGELRGKEREEEVGRRRVKEKNKRGKEKALGEEQGEQHQHFLSLIKEGQANTLSTESQLILKILWMNDRESSYLAQPLAPVPIPRPLQTNRLLSPCLNICCYNPSPVCTISKERDVVMLVGLKTGKAKGIAIIVDLHSRGHLLEFLGGRGAFQDK